MKQINDDSIHTGFRVFFSHPGLISSTACPDCESFPPGAIIGIVVGCVLAIIVILVIFIIARRKKHDSGDAVF